MPRCIIIIQLCMTIPTNSIDILSPVISYPLVYDDSNKLYWYIIISNLISTCVWSFQQTILICYHQWTHIHLCMIIPTNYIDMLSPVISYPLVYDHSNKLYWYVITSDLISTCVWSFQQTILICYHQWSHIHLCMIIPTNYIDMLSPVISYPLVYDHSNKLYWYVITSDLISTCVWSFQQTILICYHQWSHIHLCMTNLYKSLCRGTHFNTLCILSL